MFGKDATEAGGTPVATGGDARTTSILAQGCTFKGEVQIQGIFRVEGDIRTRRLVIDEGVFFEGNCSMGDKKPAMDKQPVRPGTSDVKQATAS